MELTEQQELLMDGLKLLGVETMAIVGIVLCLENHYQETEELMLYMAKEHPNQSQILKKVVELVPDEE